LLSGSPEAIARNQTKEIENMRRVKLERIEETTDPFDKRHQDPKKNYGIGGEMKKMIAKGPAGAIQFVWSTGIQMPHVTNECRDKYGALSQHLLNLEKPMGYDVGYHSLKPMYENHEHMGACPFLDGKDCYYDGSSLRADEWLKILQEKGKEAIWELLEKEYVVLFGEAK